MLVDVGAAGKSISAAAAVLTFICHFGSLDKIILLDVLKQAFGFVPLEEEHFLLDKNLLQFIYSLVFHSVKGFSSYFCQNKDESCV